MASKELYDAFLEKVRRTVYIDNLSPIATEAAVRSAFDQYGVVKSVHFIPNYLERKNNCQCVLVEMEEQIQASHIIKLITEHPFMICGMPRPVRARPAKVEMFADQPKKPGRQIFCQWLEQSDPNFDVARKMKPLAKKHASEVDFVLKKQQDLELELHRQQWENLKLNHKKFQKVDSLTSSGRVHQLGQCYNLNISDDLKCPRRD